MEGTKDKRAEGFYDKMGTLGAHEMIVEDRSHSQDRPDFERQRWRASSRPTRSESST